MLRSLVTASLMKCKDVCWCTVSPKEQQNSRSYTYLSLRKTLVWVFLWNAYVLTCPNRPTKYFSIPSVVNSLALPSCWTKYCDFNKYLFSSKSTITWSAHVYFMTICHWQELFERKLKLSECTTLQQKNSMDKMIFHEKCCFIGSILHIFFIYINNEAQKSELQSFKSVCFQDWESCVNCNETTLMTTPEVLTNIYNRMQYDIVWYSNIVVEFLPELNNNFSSMSL